MRSASADEYALLHREPDAWVAVDGSRAITARTFVAAVHQLAIALPSQSYAINLCRDRLNFLLTLCAVIVRRQCSLLPPNGQTGTVQTLRKDYPDSYILHDGYAQSLPEIASLDISTGSYWNQLAPFEIEIPMIPAQQPCAISFTSGSTGQSRPNLKTWSMLLRGAKVNAANMLIGAPPDLNILATVPAQHMYGLELTTTLPLVSNVTVHAGQPLYPDDVMQALNNMPEPRSLVSTPQHLRALVKSGLSFPRVERVFCATAPLEQILAEQVESCFDGELVEIFGCSEIGSIARRRTAIEQNWTPFDTMRFSTQSDTTFVVADHVPEPVELQDTITLHTDGSFQLRGRHGDLINIAGKRGSLHQLNQLLLSIPGIDDGVIFNPAEQMPEHKDKPVRLAAIVVSEQLDKAAILKVLRSHVDPVFLPRPILFTDSLPRSETSKLPRQAVLDTYQQLRGAKSTVTLD